MDEHEKDQAALAAQKPFSLNGETYLISPPTLSDMAAIAAQVRRKAETQTPIARLVNDPAFKLLPRECQVEAAREAAKAQVAGEAAVGTAELVERLISPEVLSFAIWICARKAHPDLQLEVIRLHVTEDNVVALFVEFTEASGILALGNVAGHSGSQVAGMPLN